MSQPTVPPLLPLLPLPPSLQHCTPFSFPPYSFAPLFLPSFIPSPTLCALPTDTHHNHPLPPFPPFPPSPPSLSSLLLLPSKADGVQRWGRGHVSRGSQARQPSGCARGYGGGTGGRPLRLRHPMHGGLHGGEAQPGGGRGEGAGDQARVGPRYHRGRGHGNQR